MINFLDDQRHTGVPPFKSVPIKIVLGKWAREFNLSWPRAPHFFMGIAHRDFGGISVGSRRVPFRLYYPTAGLDLDWRMVDKFFSLNVFRQARPFTGVDIGADSIKVIALRHDGRQYHLHAAEQIPLSPECVKDGVIENVAKVAEALKAVSRDGRFNRKVALGIGGHDVTVKKISLPKSSQAELDSSMMWEASQHIPWDIKEVYVGYEILNPDVGMGQMEVLLCAVRKGIVSDYIAAAREAGLEPVAVGVNSQAMERCVCLGDSEAIKTGTVALVNIGASLTSVEVLENGIADFWRDVGMGGHMLTDEIMRMLSVSRAEANFFQEDMSEIDSDMARNEVLRLTRRVAGTIVTEVQRSIEFYKATSCGAEIKEIYVTGGMAQSDELRQVLASRLEVPVQLIDPFRGIVVDPKKFDLALLNARRARFAVAMGLALGQG